MSKPYYLDQTTIDDFIRPRARLSDPVTAHEAASVVAPGNADLIRAIRSYVWSHGASTAFEVADALAGRWQPDSIRTAMARAGLEKWEGGQTPNGRRCMLYGLPTETVETGDRL